MMVSFVLSAFIVLMSQVYGQQVTPVQQNVNGIKGKSVKFQWTVSRGNASIGLVSMSLLNGTTPDLNRRLFNSDGQSIIKAENKTDRLKADIDGNAKEDIAVTVNLMLENIQFEDKSASFYIFVVFLLPTVPPSTASIGATGTIVEVKGPREPPAEPKSNTGAIAGGVVGGILFLILVGIAVFFLLRWKKSKSSGHRDESGKSLRLGSGSTYEPPQYADTSLAMNRTEPKEPPSAQTYMDLGPGGGRIGERINPPPQSHYREVKNEEDAPPKPKRGIMRQDSDGNTISDDVNV